MEIDMKKLTKKETKELSLTMWRWLAKDGSNKYKFFRFNPEYEFIEKYKHSCPLCELFVNEYRDDDCICEKCPLNSCYDSDSLFVKWIVTFKNVDIKIRKMFAQQIVEKIEAWDIGD